MSRQLVQSNGKFIIFQNSMLSKFTTSKGNTMDLEKIKRLMPWWLKIVIKLLLWPVPNRILFRTLGFYKHGFMIDPHYAISIVESHKQRSGFDFTNAVIIEIGPGDSISTGIIAWAMGANKVILVDNGDYVTKDIRVYNELIRSLFNMGFEKVDELKECKNYDELLHKTRTTYLTQGVQSLKGIKDQSIDFCFSQAVLEHIAFNEFEDLIDEMYRIQKLGGLCSHQIDLTDHLGGGLNSLRFSTKIWESNFFKRAGFYTNRLRYNKILGSFSAVGYIPIKIEKNEWSKLPLAISKLAPEFRMISEHELLISSLYLVCEK